MTYSLIKSYFHNRKNFLTIERLSLFDLSFLFMKISDNHGKSFHSSYTALAIVSIFALALTFFVSNIDLSFPIKFAVFALIVAVYIVSVTAFYYRQKRSNNKIAFSGSKEGIFNGEVEEKLLILEEASEFFASSLKSADMFRLVSSRINELIPFSSCVLHLIGEDKTQFRIVHAVGENKQNLKNLTVNVTDGLAGKIFIDGKPALDQKLSLDKKVVAPDFLKGFKCAIAAPLKKNAEIFGVLQLFGASENDFNADSLVLIESIAERVAPLLSSSMAFERSLSSAMTDSLTDLPNERAFYLMLENQIAEAQRFPEKRQLTVLVTDIMDFAELNKSYGHATGDRILAFAAKMIKSQLRQMDFLSRSVNDEFFAVLPTAGEEITETIIKRIERVFILQPFEISAKDKVHLKLNFGAATFLNDSETANNLLQTALLRKHQGKSEQASNIIWFPKEYVN